MKRMIAAMSSLVLVSALALVAVAQDPTPAKSGMEKAKTTKKVAAVPTDDAGIQKCITDKLAASAALKGEGFTVTVKDGEATITGTTKIAGRKGGATRIAKGCGAKKVVNNVTVEAAAKAAKGEKKTATGKQP